MPNNEKALIIDASATKEFFINILVRDIALSDAIVDLVDNCVDGAKRLRPNGSFIGLEIRINFSTNHFSIADNCGGISVDTARKYAFRFGRDVRSPKSPNSIGQFGVGMKRALFKMGNKIHIQSQTTESNFSLDLDVAEWTREESDRWDLMFSSLSEGMHNSPDTCGTIIRVEQLRSGVDAEFGLSNFETRLRWLIETGHADSLAKGLSIFVQGRSLTGPLARLLDSTGLKPVFRQKLFKYRSNDAVHVRIYAGVAESSPTDAGWYIACNGRTILRADQTITTGWGEDREATIPKYHNQFARFRGFVFFDSKDAGALPWNTTKTDVNTDSPIYQAVRLDMVSSMRPVIDFLNKLDAEKDADVRPLTALVSKAMAVKLDSIKKADAFSYKASASSSKQEHRQNRIQYSRPEAQVNAVKRSLGVSTLTSVGEKTFDYYYNLECKD